MYAVDFHTNERYIFVELITCRLENLGAIPRDSLSLRSYAAISRNCGCQFVFNFLKL